MPENWLQPTIRPPLPTGPYVVAGVSRAGSAAALALKAIVPEREIWVYDDLPYSSHAEITLKAIAELGLRRLELEDGKLPPTLDFDGGALVKSPGIRDDAAIVRAARSTGMVVIDEAELGWRLDTRPQVGVTGTNGKSTTAMLTAQLLRSAGRAPIVAGNSTFGPPLSAAAAEPGDVVVAELSSFQLESCTDLMSPTSPRTTSTGTAHATATPIASAVFSSATTGPSASQQSAWIRNSDALSPTSSRRLDPRSSASAPIKVPSGAYSSPPIRQAME
jgi:UDP-N-acetylmuramoylalanine-D-glutamate ligase